MRTFTSAHRGFCVKQPQIKSKVDGKDSLQRSRIVELEDGKHRSEQERKSQFSATMAGIGKSTVVMGVISVKDAPGKKVKLRAVGPYNVPIPSEKRQGKVHTSSKA